MESIEDRSALAREVLRFAAVRREFDLLLSSELPALATLALASGLDSGNLRRLAGELNPSWADSGGLFEGVLRDFAIPIPARREAGVALARYYAEQILKGEVTPYEGARNIWWQVANEFVDDPEIWESLVNFVGLASEWEDHAAGREEYEREILKHARQLVERDA